MGWIGFPKYQWRGFGILLILIGLLALVFAQNQVGQIGIFLIIIGALITAVNG